VQQRRRKGRKRKNQPNVRNADALANGSNAAPTMRPTATLRARLNAFAASIVRRPVPVFLPKLHLGYDRPHRTWQILAELADEEHVEALRARRSSAQAEEHLTPEHETRTGPEHSEEY